MLGNLVASFHQTPNLLLDPTTTHTPFASTLYNGQIQTSSLTTLLLSANSGKTTFLISKTPNIHTVSTIIYRIIVGRDISVGIVTRYGLDGTGIESQWGRDLPHLSRTPLGPTQPPIKCLPGLSWR